MDQGFLGGPPIRWPADSEKTPVALTRLSDPGQAPDCSRARRDTDYTDDTDRTAQVHHRDACRKDLIDVFVVVAVDLLFTTKTPFRRPVSRCRWVSGSIRV